MKNALVYFKTQSEYHFEKMQKAVDTFGKYELYSWHTSQKYKPLTQKDIDIAA